MELRVVFLAACVWSAQFSGGLACFGSSSGRDGAPPPDGSDAETGDESSMRWSETGQIGDGGSEFAQGSGYPNDRLGSWTCTAPQVQQQKGNICCNKVLEDAQRRRTMNPDPDIQTTAEKLRDDVENRYGGRWETVVSKSDFGFANYRMDGKHCKVFTSDGKVSLSWQSKSADAVSSNKGYWSPSDAAVTTNAGTWSCTGPQIQAVRGDICCNTDLMQDLSSAAEIADDLQAAAEDVRAAAEKRYGGLWEAIVSKTDFGFAYYRVDGRHCKVRTPTATAMAWQYDTPK